MQHYREALAEHHNIHLKTITYSDQVTPETYTYSQDTYEQTKNA
jgi:hypothetical protein